MPGGPPACHWPPTPCASCGLRRRGRGLLPCQARAVCLPRSALPETPRVRQGSPCCRRGSGSQRADVRTEVQSQGSPQVPSLRLGPEGHVSTPPSRRCCLASGTFQAILGTSTSHPTVRICTLFSSLLSPRLFTLATDWRRSLGLAGNSRIRGQKSSDRLLWPTPANPVADAPRCVWRFYSVPR